MENTFCFVFKKKVQYFFARNWITDMSNANFTQMKEQSKTKDTLLNPLSGFIFSTSCSLMVIQSNALCIYTARQVYDGSCSRTGDMVIGFEKKVTQIQTQIYGYGLCMFFFLVLLHCIHWNIEFCILDCFHSNSDWIKHAFLCILLFVLSFFFQCERLPNVFRINLPQLRTSR